MQTKAPIQIRAGDLKQTITGLGKIISRKATLPALQCVKVEAINRKAVQLTATDLKVTLRIEVEAETPADTPPFLLPLGFLRDLVKGHRAADVVLLNIPPKAIPLSEFPELPSFRAAPVLLKNETATSLLRAFTCASHDETRYVLRGAYLDTSGSGPSAHRIVGTDGRQSFSSNSLHLPNIKEPVILPDHPLWQWKPVAGSRPWTLRIGAVGKGEQPFRIDGPFWSISGTCLEGNYPNYRQVIPPASDFKTTVEMSVEVGGAMAGHIPKLPGRKLDNRPVGIRVDKGLVSLLARGTTEEPWQLHPIGKARSKGPDFTVFANRDYVERAVRFGLHQLEVTDHQSPLQFSRKGDLMIVMPVRVTGTDAVKHGRGVRPLVVEQAKPVPAAPKPKPTRRVTASPKKKAAGRKPAPSRPAKVDSLTDAETRIAVVNEALRKAGRELDSASGSLKAVRKHRRADQEELKGFRSLFQSIKQIAKGGNN